MPDGWHYQKRDEKSLRGRARRWWAFELAAVIAVAALVAVDLIAVSGGPSSHDAGQRTPAATAIERAAVQSHSVTSMSTMSSTASTSKGGPTTTVPPDPTDPYLQPNGSAEPVMLTYNGNTITLKGAVPTAADGQRLAAIAESYSTTPITNLETNFVVDPRVPTSTGVRVVEEDSVRFAVGSSEITPQYAPTLARVINILKAIPALTALVIGHSDQTGDPSSNLTLSYQRATAVVQYLVTQGIDPSRLTAQGVGSANPLTPQTDAAGLALNRRTEFIFYGLLAAT